MMTFDTARKVAAYLLDSPRGHEYEMLYIAGMMREWYVWDFEKVAIFDMSSNSLAWASGIPVADWAIPVGAILSDPVHAAFLIKVALSEEWFSENWELISGCLGNEIAARAKLNNEIED